jgi:hypothetical protein
MNMKYRHPDKLIIQIIPEYFDSLLNLARFGGGGLLNSGNVCWLASAKVK